MTVSHEGRKKRTQELAPQLTYFHMSKVIHVGVTLKIKKNLVFLCPGHLRAWVGALGISQVILSVFVIHGALQALVYANEAILGMSLDCSRLGLIRLKELLCDKSTEAVCESHDISLTS